jgi:hypothetical protein
MPEPKLLLRMASALVAQFWHNLLAASFSSFGVPASLLAPKGISAELLAFPFFSIVRYWFRVFGNEGERGSSSSF